MVTSLSKNLCTFQNKLINRENEYYYQFMQKKKLRSFYKFKYQVGFTAYEFTNYSLDEFITIGEGRRIKKQLHKKELKAAKVIQTAVRKFLAKRRYEEYLRKYQETQNR